MVGERETYVRPSAWKRRCGWSLETALPRIWVDLRGPVVSGTTRGPGSADAPRLRGSDRHPRDPPRPQQAPHPLHRRPRIPVDPSRHHDHDPPTVVVDLLPSLEVALPLVDALDVVPTVVLDDDLALGPAEVEASYRLPAHVADGEVDPQLWQAGEHDEHAQPGLHGGVHARSDVRRAPGPCVAPSSRRARPAPRAAPARPAPRRGPATTTRGRRPGRRPRPPRARGRSPPRGAAARRQSGRSRARRASSRWVLPTPGPPWRGWRTRAGRSRPGLPGPSDAG